MTLMIKKKTLARNRETKCSKVKHTKTELGLCTYGNNSMFPWFVRASDLRLWLGSFAMAAGCTSFDCGNLSRIKNRDRYVVIMYYRNCACISLRYLVLWCH